MGSLLCRIAENSLLDHETKWIHKIHGIHEFLDPWNLKDLWIPHNPLPMCVGLRVGRRTALQAKGFHETQLTNVLELDNMICRKFVFH